MSSAEKVKGTEAEERTKFGGQGKGHLQVSQELSVVTGQTRHETLHMTCKQHTARLEDILKGDQCDI